MPGLPIGTVTFLFTDIQGSTRLVQELGDKWTELLARHGAILRKAIADGGGTEVSTEGDAFFAVFPTASGAIIATVTAQQALAAESWPKGNPIRVRMGLHTGEAILGGDNYIGLDVHRAARIAAAGHGGQVVLSDATRALSEPTLPTGVALQDLGVHRLKDLARPERLFQLDIVGLPVKFPSVRTIDARPNLPVQLTSFVGRQKDIDAIGRLLEKARFITLTGPGGTGKTRLALQVAADVISRFKDGAFFVELAPISDPALVVATIASSLGILESIERPLTETVREWLTNREVLLVLDNFEQVAAATPLVTDLLTGAPNLRVVVTSRAILRASGEHEFPVQPLRVPDPAHLPSLESLSSYEAVALFIERAMAAHHDFAVTNESAPAVAEIAARLDGLPLALELAAARTRLLSPQAILGRLGSTLAFLAGGPRDLPARQQTLRGAIEWSYGLLEASEKTLFRRLSVFRGGWTLEAADAICLPAEFGLDALESLAALADQSLIRHQEGEHGEPRFAMLETIRQFGDEQLAEAGEEAEIRGRHASYFLSVAEAAEPELTSSAQVVDRIGHDHDNFRTTLTWAIETGSAELGFRLGYALWRFWHLRSHLREGRQWFERLLAIPNAQSPTRARALGLTGAAGIAYWQNDYPVAEAWYLEIEAIYRDLGDQPALSDALFNTASMAAIRGDLEEAVRQFSEGETIARQIGDEKLVMRHLGAKGYGALMTDDFATARPLIEETLALAKSVGSEFERAGGYHMVAQVDRLEGNYDKAAVKYRKAIEIFRDLGASAPIIEPLQGLAAVEVASGDPLRGVRLLGGVDAIRDRIGGGPPPEWIRLGDPVSDARQAIGDEQVEQALAEGRAMADDEIVRYALEGSYDSGI